ncbi:MAG TPA: outer membrane lipoprotein-sorting protein [Blastocatellia bacterium]|nr:outer membrane lipoprotein-sorting protein [Blastocatellia bacterium]
MKIISSPSIGDTLSGSRLPIVLLCAGLLALSACKHGSENAPLKAEPAGRASTAPAANEIVSRFRALDNSKNSTVQVRVEIRDQAGSPRSIQMTMYRKRQDDGGQKLLMDLSASPEERDRSAVILFGPGGTAEATRFIQSNDSFVTTTTVTGEDSLFGMTLQELADGQTEKYDYTLSGEETVGSTPVYKVEGKLKPAVESKFPRLVMSLARDNGALQVAEFYDNRNELARRLTVTRLEEVGGHLTRMHWNVDNIARGKKLDFQVIGVKYDTNLNDSIFSKEYLKRISSR